MKKITLLTIISSQIISAFAQEIPRQSIEDSVIGWMKIYHFKGSKEPLKVDTKTYSAAQLSVGDSLANWIQASYIPKGGLGDVKKAVSTEQFFDKYYAPALPPNYGAYAKVYYFLKKNSSGKLVPATSHGALWSIMANEVPPYFIRGLSTSGQAYFTIPGVDAELLNDPGSAEYREAKLYGLSNHPIIGKYISMTIPEAAGYQQKKVVILCKDNKLPFIHVTIGEVLRMAEEVIPVHWEIERKKIFEKTQGNQKDIDFYTKSEMDKIEKAKITLSKLREKYKSRINEPAYLNEESFELINLANGYDIFTGSQIEEPSTIKKTYPVYKVDPAVQALCKTNNPQWIFMYWTGFMNDPLEKHLHESIINNFNFDYVYNFFFDPGKVKGQPYKPLRSPSYKEAEVVTEGSETSKRYKADKNIFFFEDFSTTATGKKPNGWNSKLNYYGQPCIVSALDGEPGNWVELKGNESLLPNQLKKPLPQNFTLSYDVVAPQNFTWGGKALAMQLSKETKPGDAESYFIVKLRPGYDGRDGEAELETKFTSPPGYATGTKWMKAPGFSNNKKTNRITVTIKKKEESLQVFIDKAKIMEYEKAIPAALLFNALSFTHARSDGVTEKYYISNIKITND